MKLIFAFLLMAAVCLTGCFSAHKKHESFASHETFDTEGNRTGKTVWRDRSKGGGVALFSDPTASQIHSDNTNQTALGGGSTLNVGEISSVARPDAIDATGGAVGEGAGAFFGVSDIKLPTVPKVASVAGNPVTPVSAKNAQTENFDGKDYILVQEPDELGRGLRVWEGPDGKNYTRTIDGKMIPLP